MKTFAIIPLICLLATNLSAQTTEPEYSWYKDRDKNYHGRFTIAIHPSQLLTHANFRVDAEMRLKDTRQWLQLGLDIPFGDEWDRGDFDYDEDYSLTGAFGLGLATGTGFGLNVNYKYFFHRYFYAAGGPSWHYYNTDRRYYGWSQFVEDGIEYHEYGYHTFNQKINNIGFNAMCGFQKINRRNFLVDVYLGVTAQKAFHANPDADKFNSTMYSRGYSGCVFLIGFRIGFAGKPR